MSMTADAVEPIWTLGNRIWRARLHAGLEQAEVAEALGVSRALVSRWEKDLSDPRVGQLHQIAELTGVSFTWLSTTMYESTPFTLVYGEVPEQRRLFTFPR